MSGPCAEGDGQAERKDRSGRRVAAEFQSSTQMVGELFAKCQADAAATILIRAAGSKGSDGSWKTGALVAHFENELVARDQPG